MKRARSVWNRCSGSSVFMLASGQLYKPHDSDILLYYKEAKDGQILEEGITEAGSMAVIHRRRHRLRQLRRAT